MPALAQGSRGSDVMDLQRRLSQMGYAVGAIDGIYGPITARAVQAFQQASGIAADGYYGPETESALAGGGAPVGGPVAPAAQASPVAINPENDPQFLAFMRAQGLSDAQIRGNIAYQRSQVQRNVQNRLPDIDEAQRVEYESIGQQYLARGFYGGGEQQRDSAYATANFARQRNELQTGAADQQAELERQLVQHQVSQTAGRAEEELAARRRLQITQAESGTY